MHHILLSRRCAARALLSAALVASPWIASGQEPASVPDGGTDAKARETFVRVCTKCHPADRVTAEGRSRSQWETTIISMQTARGAALTPEEFDIVLGYLTKFHGRDSVVQPPEGRGGQAAGGRGGQAAGGRGPRAHVGAADRHRVNDEAAERGKKTYAAQCVTCHGSNARGTDTGANLIRSPLVLRDRYGSAIGPFLKRGHPTQTGAPSTGLTAAEVTDLSHFIWQRINDTLQGSPAYEARDVLTGNAQRGQAYFTGEGRCATCHSPAGDLAGYGRKHNPVDIQQRFVFPAAAAGRGASRRPVTVTVTVPDSEPVSGVLVSLDDFHVSLRDPGGRYRSFARTPAMTIVKSDPYRPHVDLLYRLTDKAMHDVVAYLETLK
jgi:mono/diheme cytochrome c family protein